MDRSSKQTTFEDFWDASSEPDLQPLLPAHRFRVVNLLLVALGIVAIMAIWPVSVAIQSWSPPAGADALSSNPVDAPASPVAGSALASELLAAEVLASAAVDAADDAEAIGLTTSGGYGFTVGKSLAFAYVTADHAEPGNELGVMILGEMKKAVVLSEPAFDPDNTELRS